MQGCRLTKTDFICVVGGFGLFPLSPTRNPCHIHRSPDIRPQGKVRARGVGVPKSSRIESTTAAETLLPRSHRSIICPANEVVEVNLPSSFETIFPRPDAGTAIPEDLAELATRRTVTAMAAVAHDGCIAGAAAGHGEHAS